MYKRQLVDRVIPMLPRELSNGICSLNEGCDRLALSCIRTINKKGEVIDQKIAETVIKTNRRMTYTNVKKILADKDAAVIEEYKELVPCLLYTSCYELLWRITGRCKCWIQHVP